MTEIEADRYFDLTGQTMQEVFQGERQHGFEYIENLMKKAIKENKKVVFIPDKDSRFGYGEYELQPL